MARVIETNPWRGGDLIVSDSPDIAELCALAKAWSPELAELIAVCAQTRAERTCHLIGPPDVSNSKRCSECESSFGLYQILSQADEGSYGKYADAKFCPCCGARIVGS